MDSFKLILWKWNGSKEIPELSNSQIRTGRLDSAQLSAS